MQVAPIMEKMREYQLRWLDHLRWCDVGYVGQRVKDLEVMGQRLWGRPRKTVIQDAEGRHKEGQSQLRRHTWQAFLETQNKSHRPWLTGQGEGKEEDWKLLWLVSSWMYFGPNFQSCWEPQTPFDIKGSWRCSTPVKIRLCCTLIVLV